MSEVVCTLRNVATLSELARTASETQHSSDAVGLSALLACLS
jgi:hypothetical protein